MTDVLFDLRDRLQKGIDVFLGDWHRSRADNPDGDTSFAEDDLDEPHKRRKFRILEEHPEIEDLFGYEWKTKYVACLLVGIQLACSYLLTREYLVPTPWWLWLTVAYVIGGTANHSCAMVIHDCAHDLAGESSLFNRILAIFVNVPLGVPAAMSFRRYHLQHHAYQGVAAKDPDVPVPAEAMLVRNGTIRKMIWLFCFPVLYIARGAMMGRKPNRWEVINLIAQATFNVVWAHFFGIHAVYYFLLSTWCGFSIHPMCANFIQEHYTTDDGQETYSYYGILNFFQLNVGYHNEHHDFTRVPWSRLPEVNAKAPEFYNTIHYHNSWFKVHWDFLFDPTLGPQSRVERSLEAHNNGRRSISALRNQKVIKEDIEDDFQVFGHPIKQD